jgi:hypothetical protein
MKPTRCTNFSNLFWNETLHVSDSSSAHHQEFFALHTAMVYVIVLQTSSEQDQDVLSIPKNKFEILVHLVGFIVKKHLSFYNLFSGTFGPPYPLLRNFKKLQRRPKHVGY